MTSSNAVRPLLVAGLMVLSSMAGCISTDDASTDDSNTDDTPIIIDNTTTPVEPIIFGNVMVSTYHVGELAKAVGGDNIVVEYMSQENIPVHDYEPSLTDLVRLQNSDLFLYHGLNLEPWVESTLSSMENAPPSFMTHTMPSGETTLDYDSILISNLCDLLSEGPYEATTLGEMPHDDHDQHDDHHDEGVETHGGHTGDDDHDDHDDHEEHGHAEPEKEFTNPSECPAETTIQVFHMEKGEHLLEFESDHEEDFNMAALKMLGGHAHGHHHGHGSGPFEWAGIFSINDDTHTWTMEKVDGSYADPSMRVVLIPTDTPTEETMHSLESGVEALIEGDACTVVEDGESMTPVDGGSCFEWHVGSGDISTFTINTAGISGLAAYTAHSPYEFEATQHYLKDSAGNDVEHIAEEGGGGHGDHGDHGDDHDDHGDEDGHGDHDGHDEGYCHNLDTHENYESTEEECANAGHMWTEGEGHEDHEGGMCHNTGTHENYESTEEDCANAGHVWMDNEHHDHDLPEIHADRVVHTLSFPEDMVCYDMGTHTINQTLDNEADCTGAGLMWTAANSGPGGHGDEGHHTGYLSIHIEEEGDYGFAFPNDIDFFILTEPAAPYEWAGIFESSDSTHNWNMQSVAGEDGTLAYADPSMRIVVIPTQSPNEETMHSLEGSAGDMIEGDSCIILEDGGTMTPIAENGSCFELHVGPSDDSSWTMDTQGMAGFAVFTAHSPYEFERDMHYLQDSAGADVEPIAEESSGAHDHDHGGHGDDHGDEGESEIEAGEDEEAFDYDPHSWLDPLSFNEQLNLVKEKLTMTFPEGAEIFATNAAAYSTELVQLHTEFVDAFGDQGTCAAAGLNPSFVANHNAYSYISKRYGVDIMTVHGLDPEGEPSPAEVAEVVDHIKEEGITVLYVEEYTDQTAVQSIVEETGVQIKILYTMEMRPSDSDDDYISMMNKNVQNMISGIGC